MSKSKAMPVPPTRATMKRILGLAEEMSYENNYCEAYEDEDGQMVRTGRSKSVKKDLNALRAWLGMPPTKDD